MLKYHVCVSLERSCAVQYDYKYILYDVTQKRMITGTKTPRNLVFPTALLQSKVRDGDGEPLKEAVHFSRNIWTCVQRGQTLWKAQKPTAYKLISTQEAKPVQIYKRAHGKSRILTGPD